MSLERQLTCPGCGAAGPGSARYCHQCGVRLPRTVGVGRVTGGAVRGIGSLAVTGMRLAGDPSVHRCGRPMAVFGNAIPWDLDRAIISAAGPVALPPPARSEAEPVSPLSGRLPRARRRGLHSAIARVGATIAISLVVGTAAGVAWKVSAQKPASQAVVSVRPAPSAAQTLAGPSQPEKAGPGTFDIRGRLELAAASLRSGDLATAAHELRMASRLSPGNTHAQKALSLLEGAAASP